MPVSLKYDWIIQQSSILTEDTKEIINDNSNLFIFPFTARGGYVNITNAGEKPENANPNDYIDFQRVFTGKDTVIAQWDGAFDLNREPDSFVLKGDYDHNDIDILERAKTQWSEFLTEESELFYIEIIVPISAKWNVTEKRFQYTNGAGNIVTFTIDEAITRVKRHKLTGQIIIGKNNPNIGNSFNFDFNFLKRSYSKTNASFFKGWFDNQNGSANFSPINFGSFGSGITEQYIQDLTVKTTKRIVEKDVFKFYIVPQYASADPKTTKDDVQMFYISNVTPFHDLNGEFIYNSVTFSSLNNQIRQVGVSFDNTVLLAPLGSGYTFPKLIYNDQGVATDFEINKDLQVDYGVRAIQVEIMGNSGINSFIVNGRPIEKIGVDNTKIYATRDLLVQNIIATMPNDISKVSQTSENFYIANGKREIVSSYPNWKEAQRTYDPNIVKDFEGFLTTDPEKTRQSNQGKLFLRDVAWQLPSADKSPINMDYDTRSNSYFRYQNGSTISGIDSINLSAINNKSVVSLLNLNRFLFSNMPVLPLENDQSIPWAFSDIPIIGSFLNKVAFGLPFGWMSVTATNEFPNFKGYPILIGISNYEWVTSAYWKSVTFHNDESDQSKTPNFNFYNINRKTDQGFIPMDFFKSSDKLSGMVGLSNVATRMAFTLTDKVACSAWNLETGKIVGEKGSFNVSTLMIGQKYIVGFDGEDIEVVFLLDENTHELEPADLKKNYITDIVGTQNYIVDGIGISAVARGDIRITAFANNPTSGTPYESIIFQKTLQSNAEWTNNTGSVITYFKTSDYDSFIRDKTPYNFPQAIQFQQPSNNETITINASNLSYDKTFWGNNGQGKNPRIDSLNKTDVLFDFKTLGFENWNAVLSVYHSINFTFSMSSYSGIWIETFNPETQKIDINRDDDGSRSNYFDKSYKSFSLDLLQIGQDVVLDDQNFNVKIKRIDAYAKLTHKVNFSINNNLELLITRHYESEVTSVGTLPNPYFVGFSGTNIVKFQFDTDLTISKS